MTLPLLDTNVLLRHLLQDHPAHSPRATDFLKRVEEGKLKVRTTEIVVFETVFTLQRRQAFTRQFTRHVLLRLLGLPGIMLPNKRRLRRAFDLYVEHGLSFADAYHVALMTDLKLTQIVSFDEGFDRIEEITRIEP
jgi:predicted nucleic acid-binding protein